MEDAAKLLFIIFSPFVVGPSAPSRVNPIVFLPKATGLKEEKSSQ